MIFVSVNDMEYWQKSKFGELKPPKKLQYCKNGIFIYFKFPEKLKM